MKKNIEDIVREDIATFFNVSIKRLENVDDLIIEFNVDSLDIIRLIVYLEDKYQIRYNTMRYNNMTSISSIIKETTLLIK